MAVKASPTGSLVVGGTQLAAFERQLERDRQQLRERLARDDAHRAGARKVTLVCISAFTLVEDPGEPEGRVVRPGEEIEVPACDVETYRGRAAPRVTEL